MRNGQNKRMRGRNNNHAHSHGSHGNHGHRKSHNPMARVYESNGPEVKIRGNRAHRRKIHAACARRPDIRRPDIGGKLFPARRALFPPDCRRAGAVPSEQSAPAEAGNRSHRCARREFRDGDGDEDTQQPQSGAAAGDVPYGMGEQPYLPRDAQPFPHREQPQPIARPQQAAAEEAGGDIDRLPSFITGGQGAPQASSPQSNGQNGHEPQGDRFPLHRRRRRHRGPRQDAAGGESRGGDLTPREE